MKDRSTKIYIHMWIQTYASRDSFVSLAGGIDQYMPCPLDAHIDWYSKGGREFILAS